MTDIFIENLIITLIAGIIGFTLSLVFATIWGGTIFMPSHGCSSLSLTGNKPRDTHPLVYIGMGHALLFLPKPPQCRSSGMAGLAHEYRQRPLRQMIVNYCIQNNETKTPKTNTQRMAIESMAGHRAADCQCGNVVYHRQYFLQDSHTQRTARFQYRSLLPHRLFTAFKPKSLTSYLTRHTRKRMPTC